MATMNRCASGGARKGIARALAAFVSLAFAACVAEPGPSSWPDPAASLEPAGDSLGGADDPNGDEPGGPAGPQVAGCPSGRWCSSLYPPGWMPDSPADAKGRFLHDFSYAGYHNGEAPPVAPPGAIYDVVAGFGADPSGKLDAADEVQSAIDAASAAGGGVVFFPHGTYRIGQTLTVAASKVVLRGEGASSVLRFTKGKGMAYSAALVFRGSVTRAAPRKLVADAAPRARELFVEDASGLAPGDDVGVGWTITPAFIADHGMNGVWTEFTDRYETIFKRKVVSVDTSSRPHRVVVDVPLRYEAKTRDGAAVHSEAGYLREVGLEHLGVTTAVTWDEAWAEDQAYAVSFRDVADAWVDDVHSVASPAGPKTGIDGSDQTAYHLRSGGLEIASSTRVSVLRSSMELPQNRGSGGNGYLFQVSRTSEVLFADCVARRGRHNFIQNWGFGNSGTVFLRCTSAGSEMLSLIGGRLTPERAFSEHHHSLAMATLVDDCTLEDGFNFENRGDYSEGAGHTGTGSVVWGAGGHGKVTSRQYGWGYVIGTRPGLEVDNEVDASTGKGTAPADFVEGRAGGQTLFPQSLYEDQRARRFGVTAPVAP